MKIGKDAYIAPLTWIDNDVEIGARSKVYQFTVLKAGFRLGHESTIGNLVATEPNAKIGSHVTVYSQGHLTTGLVVEDWVFLGPMFMGTNTRRISHGRDYPVVREAPLIKRGAALGACVTLLPGVIIGENAIVGAGSVITKSVPDREVWAGYPARKLRDVDEEETLDFEAKRQACDICRSESEGES